MQPIESSKKSAYNSLLKYSNCLTPPQATEPQPPNPHPKFSICCPSHLATLLFEDKEIYNQIHY